jgi:hypothetical protein
MFFLCFHIFCRNRERESRGRRREEYLETMIQKKTSHSFPLLPNYHLVGGMHANILHDPSMLLPTK